MGETTFRIGGNHTQESAWVISTEGWSHGKNLILGWGFLFYKKYVLNTFLCIKLIQT
jgi:hypothetical protein